MTKFIVKGFDRETGAPAETIVEANTKDDAAQAAGLLVEKVSIYNEPIVLPKIEFPQYPALLYSSAGMKWTAIVLAPCYLIAKIINWYMGFYGEWEDVLNSLTDSGIINHVLTTVFGLILIGLLYVGGEMVSAFRDVAMNSHHRTD